MAIKERPTVNSRAVMSAPSRTSRQDNSTSGKILNMAANSKVTTSRDTDISKPTIAQPGTGSHSCANAIMARNATDIASETSSVNPIAKTTVRDNSRLFTKIQMLLADGLGRSEEHTSELQSRGHLVCRLL